VTDEGQHIDVYRDGKKCQQEYVTPPMLVGVALEFAEDQLIETTQKFTRGSEGWHETKNQ